MNRSGGGAGREMTERGNEASRDAVSVQPKPVGLGGGGENGRLGMAAMEAILLRRN